MARFQDLSTELVLGILEKVLPDDIESVSLASKRISSPFRGLRSTAFCERSTPISRTWSNTNLITGMTLEGF